MTSQGQGARENDKAAGVILLQIDGLSRHQLHKALDAGRLPFLERLLHTGGFRLCSFYSGVPSTTPAVQAELFYGLRCAVPAFRFLHRKSDEDWLMLDPLRVKQLAEQMARSHEGLLKGGTSYSNIYAGGASEARYCIENLDPDEILHRMRPLQTLWVFLQHLGKVTRIAGLALTECALALRDFFLGKWRRGNFWKELKFIPTRIWVCTILRELIRFRVKLDIRHGVPVICANFVGYDEHAHRRGPDSNFARWTLEGIDGVLRDIHETSLRGKKRAYHLVFFSDHGQEDVTPYQLATGQNFSAGLKKAFAAGPLADLEVVWAEELLGHNFLFQRGRNLMRKHAADSGDEKRPDERIVATALGPLGHVYVPEELTWRDREYYAQRLVERAGIPLVLFRSGQGACAVTRQGSFPLVRENTGQILGSNHPFPGSVIEDLKHLLEHKNAGEFIVSGWRSDGQPISFPMENGAHGGPGYHETEGFLCLPPALTEESASVIRPLDLRRMIRGLRDGEGGLHG